MCEQQFTSSSKTIYILVLKIPVLQVDTVTYLDFSVFSLGTYLDFKTKGI